MDLFGRYSGGRHDTDPVVSGYSFARHGRGVLGAFKRFCVSLLARVVRTTALVGRRPETTALGARFPRISAIGARRPLTTALAARRPVTTALRARLGEC